MWILKGPKGEEHYLTTNKMHVVSRKAHGDIVLADDESVSRTHAKLEVTFNEEHVGDPTCLPNIFLIECNSKYGTYVNKGISTNSRLPEETRLQLKDGDRVKFGIQHNEWKLHHVPLITTTSTLNKEQKLRLSEKVVELGGHMVLDWRDDCTHVTMNKIMLTVKVVCALARGRRIVTPEYWQHYLSAAKSKSELPDYTSHIPPLAERSLSTSNVSFTISERRALLFKGKLFVFHSMEQHNAFSCMVFAAGGMCVIADGCGMSHEEMLEPHVIVMGYPFERGSQETQFTDSFKELKSFLVSKGKRLISESEIGLAVLHCSVERYCNPQFSTENSGSASQSQVVLSRNTHVRFTQEVSQPQEKPQSPQSSQDSFPSLRTKRRNRVPAVIVESDSESSAPEPEDVPKQASYVMNKVVSTETSESGEISSRKRLRSIVDVIENPSKKLASETCNLNQTVQAHDNSVSQDNDLLLDNSSEGSTSRAESTDRDMFSTISRQDRNIPTVAHSLVRAKVASRRKRESSDEEGSLFTFVDDPRKPATRQKNDSDNEENALFTFVDEAETNHVVNKRRIVRNSSDSDEDDDAATKFVFVEDTSAKFAETYFPDKTWASTKRRIQEVDYHDSSVDEPPQKRPSVETSRKMTNKTVLLDDFISVLKIKDEGAKDRDYASGLPDYVLGMNNTVVVTVSDCFVNCKSVQDRTVNVRHTSNVKNCKKFKKVNPVRKNIVPTIIGGSDLVNADSLSQHHTANCNIAEPEDRHQSTFHFVDD